MHDFIPVIAARAATLLSAWLDLDPLQKADNGDRSGTGGLAQLLGGMLAAQQPPPPTDAVARIGKYIADQLVEREKRSGGSVYLTFDSDYGPGRELSALSQACEISTAWPYKSHLAISLYSDGVTIHDARGYGAEGLTHHLIPGRGWLVSPCNVPARLRSIVLAAVDRGEVDPKVARLDPL